MESLCSFFKRFRKLNSSVEFVEMSCGYLECLNSSSHKRGVFTEIRGSSDPSKAQPVHLKNVEQFLTRYSLFLIIVVFVE